MNKEQIIADMAEAMEYAIGYKFERLNLCAQAAYDASPLAHVGELVEALIYARKLLDEAYACEYEIIENALSRFKDYKATPAPVSVEGWMPIETAPKDGTRILVLVRWEWHKGNSEYSHDIAKWIDHNGGGWTYHVNGIITHWQHLPKLPQTEGNKS